MIQPMPKDIYKSEYDYAVPEELIAKFPTKKIELIQNYFLIPRKNLT